MLVLILSKPTSGCAVLCSVVHTNLVVITILLLWCLWWGWGWKVVKLWENFISIVRHWDILLSLCYLNCFIYILNALIWHVLPILCTFNKTWWTSHSKFSAFIIKSRRVIIQLLSTTTYTLRQVFRWKGFSIEFQTEKTSMIKRGYIFIFLRTQPERSSYLTHFFININKLINLK